MSLAINCIKFFFYRSNLAKLNIFCPQLDKISEIGKNAISNATELYKAKLKYKNRLQKNTTVHAEESHEEERFISDGEIVAISIAVVFLLIFIACLILICYHRCPFCCCKKAGGETAYLH